MPHNMKWLDISSLNDIKALVGQIYEDSKETYPIMLEPDLKIFELFLVPQDVNGSEWRKTLGIYDSDNNLVMIAGIRRMQFQPIWLLNFVVSSTKNISMVRTFRDMIIYLCDYHESVGINEWYVANPNDKEENYRKIMKFLRERYITWVECVIKAGERSPWPVYHSMLGHATHNHDVNLHRYVKRRDRMEPGEE